MIRMWLSFSWVLRFWKRSLQIQEPGSKKPSPVLSQLLVRPSNWRPSNRPSSSLFGIRNLHVILSLSLTCLSSVTVGGDSLSFLFLSSVPNDPPNCFSVGRWADWRHYKLLWSLSLKWIIQMSRASHSASQLHSDLSVTQLKLGDIAWISVLGLKFVTENCQKVENSVARVERSGRDETAKVLSISILRCLSLFPIQIASPLKVFSRH